MHIRICMEFRTKSEICMNNKLAEWCKYFNGKCVILNICTKM